MAASVGLAVLGWVVLTYPFRGDQAVYALIGRQMMQGSVLYTDLWDIKQPGIFLWYGAADLAGLGEFGTRALDVLAALALGALVWLLLRARVRTPWVRRWIPFLVPGAAFLAGGPGDFGELEMLCLVPAVGALVLVAATPSRIPSLGRVIGAGLCLGLVGTFKLVLAGVPAAAVVLYLLLVVGQGRRVRYLLTVTAAAAVPVAVVLGWLASQGALAAAIQTWFVDPTDMATSPDGHSVARLFEGGLRLAIVLAPAVVLGLWQAMSALRRRDPLDLALATWLVLNVVAISIQFGWWYQWYFLMAPLLILALRRLDALAPQLAPAKPGRIKRIALLSLLCAPMLAHGAAWAGAAALDGGGVTAASQARIDERVARYDTIRAELAAAGVGPQDSLHVLADPLYNYLGDHPLVVRTDGWGYDLFAPRQWQDTAREVLAVRPTFVFLEPAAVPMVLERAPELHDVLAEHYTMVRTSSEGTWYRLLPAGS